MTGNETELIVSLWIEREQAGSAQRVKRTFVVDAPPRSGGAEPQRAAARGAAEAAAMEEIAVRALSLHDQQVAPTHAAVRTGRRSLRDTQLLLPQSNTREHEFVSASSFCSGQIHF